MKSGDVTKGIGANLEAETTAEAVRRERHQVQQRTNHPATKGNHLRAMKGLHVANGREETSHAKDAKEHHRISQQIKDDGKGLDKPSDHLFFVSDVMRWGVCFFGK